MTAHDEGRPAEPDGLAVAQWLHDQVVPSLVAVGLRVELARSGCSPASDAHLEHAARILEELAQTVRDEMNRRAGHSPAG